MDGAYLKKYILGIFFVLSLVSCSEAPRRSLSVEEKLADLQWVYSKVGSNYAPRDLKVKHQKTSWESLKKTYNEQAKKTANNIEFFKLLHEFAAELHDAHTRGMLFESSFPDRAIVAHLSLLTERQGDRAIVRGYLPTVHASSKLPVRIGDVITEINGLKVHEYINEELVPTRDLGDNEANFTEHAYSLFSRSSLQGNLPSADTVVLSILRGVETVKITLPWVVQDLVTFAEEQYNARRAKKKSNLADVQSGTVGQDWFSPYVDLSLFDFGLKLMEGQISLVSSVLSRYQRGKQFVFYDSFMRIDPRPAVLVEAFEGTVGQIAGRLKKSPTDVFNPDVIKRSQKTNVDPLSLVRSIPSSALRITTAQIYPAYISIERLMDAEGKEVIKDRVGYIYLDTFSPDALETDAVAEVRQTLQTFREQEVNRVVIDLINNGGGSLSLGLKLAQLFSKTKIELPQIQLRTSDVWIDDFHEAKDYGLSLEEREIAKRTYEQLIKDRNEGRLLSMPMSLEQLFPFEFQGSAELTSPFEVALLINEMCASMCDIFAGVMQDNGLAKVVGTKSMGAGGNVVMQPGMAPNSNFYLNLTESLILRKDGSYIENVGVTPDIAIKVVDSVASKYAPVRQKGVEVLLRAKSEKKSKALGLRSPFSLLEKKDFVEPFLVVSQ